MGHWAGFRHLAGVVDLAGPLPGGAYALSAGGRLFLFRPGTGSLTPFARGRDGYRTDSGEPYLTVAANAAGPGCAFSADQVFALETATHTPSVVLVDPAGQAHLFASLPAGRFLSGIAFDVTGRFGHRLLVTGSRSGKTLVYAIDCGGRVSTVATLPVPVEGGLAVAPASFGGFSGDLVAPDEQNGVVYAVTPSGQVSVLAQSGLPHGGDIGVESAGFVPAGFTAAFLADRFSGLANKHPGDNLLLRLTGTELTSAGVRAGDLLVASEGGALTIDVRCAATCTVRYVADGPRIAHGEGHVMVVTGG